MGLHKKLAVLLFMGCFAFAKAQFPKFMSSSKELLANHVVDGQVDYMGIKQNQKVLQTALQSLEKINTDDLSANECKSLLINAYNIFVIQGVVKNYPINSVMEVNDFFDTANYNLGGKMVSLNELEKNILFKQFPDERLHFALVCGASSCPPLPSKPFTAENVEFMLKKLTKKAINDPVIVKLDMHEKKVLVSKIFDWYSRDFTKDQNLTTYLNHRLENKIPDGFQVQFMEYDWGLNKK